MRHFSILFLLVAFGFAECVAHSAIEIDRIEGSVIYFKDTENPDRNPKPLQTGLQDLQVLGLLKPQKNGPFQVLTLGRPCENCTQDRAVYLLKITGGKTAQFVEPGRVFDPKTRAVLLDSRAFYGACLEHSKSDAYVVFQRERVDRRSGLPASVYAASLRDDGLLEEKLYERRMPKLSTTLKKAKSTKFKPALCREIAGRNRLMLTKAQEEDKESEDTVKESITQEELPSQTE